MLVKCLCFFPAKSTFWKNSFRNTIKSVKQFGSRSGLTFCQQKTLADEELTEMNIVEQSSQLRTVFYRENKKECKITQHAKSI